MSERCRALRLPYVHSPRRPKRRLVSCVKCGGSPVSRPHAHASPSALSVSRRALTTVPCACAQWTRVLLVLVASMSAGCVILLLVYLAIALVPTVVNTLRVLPAAGLERRGKLAPLP